MQKKIIIDSTIYQIRIALVEDGQLVELLVENKTDETIVGNIYRGVIKNVLPGMQAVFVDIGESKNGFLSLTERKTENAKKVYPGMELTVQVEKEATGTKGAKLSNEISIVGRFIVLLPDQNYIGISQKIQSKDERDRLKDIAISLKPENYGIIVRTNAENKSYQDFKNEIDTLYKKSEKILSTAEYIKAPALIYKDSSVLYRAVRDLVSEDINSIVVNDMDDYNLLVGFVADISDDFKNRVKYYDKSIPIFEYYSIQSQIEKLLQKHVWLKNGGFLIIEQTEACAVIDVNTGKFTGKKNLQQTIFKTNMEAAVEIAKQLRLRNLSGIIIVDFIDMESYENRKKLLELLEAETKKDRIKTYVVGITELGLVQITRKKSREPLSKIFLENCHHCKGTGKIRNTKYIIQNLYHEIEYIFLETIFDIVTVITSKEVQIAFCGDKNQYKSFLENKYNKKIVFQVSNSIQKNCYKLEKKKSI